MDDGNDDVVVVVVVVAVVEVAVATELGPELLDVEVDVDFAPGFERCGTAW